MFVSSWDNEMLQSMVSENNPSNTTMQRMGINGYLSLIIVDWLCLSSEDWPSSESTKLQGTKIILTKNSSKKQNETIYPPPTRNQPSCSEISISKC